jgi:hypothetical protein
VLTTISKVLAVLTTVFCLGFLGVAGVVALGGPNWQGMAENLDGYQFTYEPGENPTWSVKDMEDGESVGGPGPVLPQKIRDALNDELQEQSTEIGELGPKIEQTKGYIAATRQAIRSDVAALNRYADGLRQQLVALGQQIQQTQEERSRLTLSAEQKLQEAERLRHDQYRLENLVAAAGTDQFRAVDQQKKLRDTIERYQGMIDRLERRRDQLQQRLGAPATPAAPAAGTTNATAGKSTGTATR